MLAGLRGSERRDTGRVSPPPPAPAPPASRIPLPGLPPAGLSYDPPRGDLFATDPVAHAPSLAAIAELVASRVKCPLCERRAHTVPGEGPADARLLVVGARPRRVDAATGLP